MALPLLLLWMTCALAQAPASFEQLSARAGAAREANRADEAIGRYRRAVRLRPSWDEGWWYLGTLLYERGQHAEAAAAFRKAASIKPDNGAAWLLLGHCEFRLKRYDDALQHFLKGLDNTSHADPKLVHMGRYHAALLLNLLEEYEAAMKQILPLVENGDRTPETVRAIGLSALRMPVLPEQLAKEKYAVVAAAGDAVWALTARAADAGARYEALAAAYPHEPNVHYAYGIYLTRVNREAAVAQFEKELQVSPGHVWAMLQIAFLQLDAGEAEQALRYAQDAAKLKPGDFLPHLALGRVLLRMGETEKSIPELELASQLAPERMEPRYNLLQAYQRVGREADAAKQRAWLEAHAADTVVP